MNPWKHRVLFPVIPLLLALPPPALAEGPWEGFWASTSFGDDAYLSLRQEGSRVVGAYFPYSGRIEAIDDGGVLRGTWHSPNGSGSLTFTLSPDGDSFAGTIGSGEWWNGYRIEEDDIDFIAIDVSSPSHTIRSLMKAGYALRQGRITGLQAMFSAIHFPGEPSFAEKSRRAKLLFDLLSMTTFRVFDVRPDGRQQNFQHRFIQAGTDEYVELSFTRDVFEQWRIVAPDADFLADRLQQFLDARGMEELNPLEYRALNSPRHTMEAFMAGMEKWEVGGNHLVRETFNMSALSEGLRDLQLPVTAAFMASNLNRVGELTLQEFPDDPDSSKPFVFYSHAAGNIVIAPYALPDGGVRWQFTPSTLDQAKELYDALQRVPRNFDNVRNATGDSPFFVLREFANGLSPRMTADFAGIEIWQWISLLTLLFLLPGVCHLLGNALEKAVADGMGLRRPEARVRYGIPARMLVVGGLWLTASAFLGLPADLSIPIHALGWILVIFGVAWVLYRFIDRLTAAIHTQTRKTETTLDDVVVSLIAGLLKVLLVVATAVAVADVLSVPIETVLAGVGIGGLAFAIASKDLVANLFGSAIIAADRPFKRGDFVSLGSIAGTVENVGLRSTKLRPLDDTAVTIPNNLFTTDTVVNLTRRRKIRLVETIYIDHAATVEALQALREQIRNELLADEMVAKENVRVGLDAISLYAVEIQIACYIQTTNYDEFIYQKHRIMVHLLDVIERAGVSRAVIRRE